MKKASFPTRNSIGSLPQNRGYPVCSDELIEAGIMRHVQKFNEDLNIIRKIINQIFPVRSYRGRKARQIYAHFRSTILFKSNLDFQYRVSDQISTVPDTLPLDGISLSLVVICEKPGLLTELDRWLDYSRSLGKDQKLYLVSQGDNKLTVQEVNEGAIQETYKTNEDICIANLLKSIPSKFVLFILECDTLSDEFLTILNYSFANNQLDGDIHYFDVTLKGPRRTQGSPWFRPKKFTPVMLLSTDFLYPAIYRRQALLNRPCVEKYRIPLNSDDLWAFNLHLSEVDGLRITHLDEVCCELNSGKPAGGEDLRRALQKHLRCKGLEKVRVNKTPKGHIHASWDPKPGKVSIIIPNKDHFRDITRLVKKLKEYDLDDQLEVIIVDNGSWFLKTGNAVRLVIKRGVEKYFEKHGVLVVHYDEPFNYSRANNLGAGLASGEYLLFMNNDMTIPEPGWLNELVQWASLPEVGITSGKLLYPNGRIQAFGTVLGMHGLAGHVFRGLPDDSGTLYGHTMWYREASAVTGACMLMRREVFHSAGGFNEDYQLAFSDVEFCLQVRALGYQIVCNPYARLTHYEGKSRSDFVPYKDLHLGLQRMGFEIETGDPIYPSKMSLLNTRPSVKPNYEPTPLEVIFSNMASRSDKPG